MLYFEGSVFHDDDFGVIEVTNLGSQSVTVTNYAVELRAIKKTENMWILKPPAWTFRLPSNIDRVCPAFVHSFLYLSPSFERLMRSIKSISRRWFHGSSSATDSRSTPQTQSR